MSGPLLILLGSENQEDGTLTPQARSRCDAAVGLLRDQPELRVVPTGAFGEHFNIGVRPHGAYLTQYLKANGIGPDRILPFTVTAGTVEDALVARRVAASLEPTELIVVTSDFHMKRARYVFERVFTAQSLTFVEARTSPAEVNINAEIRREHKKLRRLQREWVDVPNGVTFPTEIYENAAEEQKHYDNVSLAIVSAIGIIFGFAGSSSSDGSATRWILFAFVVLLVAGLLLMYERVCGAARTARRLLRHIEIAFASPGFSTAYWRSGAQRGIVTMRSLVHGLSLVMLTYLLVRTANG